MNFRLLWILPIGVIGTICLLLADVFHSIAKWCARRMGVNIWEL